MKNQNYTVEKNAQIVLSLLKAKQISKVIASPGTTNIAIVGSMMHDDFFEMYSAPDERSAAYMACGLSSETGEPVVLTCTGATASRNYLPGLTEAYYRKLPIIALTSALPNAKSGHLVAQFCDRTTQPKDIVKRSVQIPLIKDSDDEWECIVKVNDALLECVRHGGGPVHINLTTSSELYDFSINKLPSVRNIERYTIDSDKISLPDGNIAIFVGSHRRFTYEETEVIDRFCANNDAVVFCDLTSGYYGKYRVQYSIAAAQNVDDPNLQLSLVIHLGEISGDYYTTSRIQKAKEIWRVSDDGELRDTFRKLTKIFEMTEYNFFNLYCKDDKVEKHCYLDKCLCRLEYLNNQIDDLPFSNIWIANTIAKKIPEGSSVHLGILNTLRSWNFSIVNQNVETYCNVGGFGIDGILSTVLGASLSDSQKLYFCFVGDLAFFYDLNSLGNRHLGNNLRVMLINNGKGTEFRNHTHPGSRFGESADLYVAAGGHYGNKSKTLVKEYANSLGFTYLSASTKNEFLDSMEIFLDKNVSDRPILFEAFTDNCLEDIALKKILSLDINRKRQITNEIKGSIREILGNGFINSFKSLLHK